MPTIEAFRDEPISLKQAAETEISQKDMLVKYVLRNRYIWILALAYFFVYIVRMVITDWGQLYLFEYKEFSLLAAGGCIFSFEVGGFFGCLASGWLSDNVFQGRRGPSNAIFGVCVILSVIGLWFIPNGGVVFAAAAMFAIGFFIFPFFLAVLFLRVFLM